METKEMKNQMGETCGCAESNCGCNCGGNTCGSSCGGSWAGHHVQHKHFLIRVVLGLLIVAFVFQLGMMFGRLESQIQAGYFDRSGMNDMRYGPGMRTMHFEVAPTTIAPAVR